MKKAVSMALSLLILLSALLSLTVSAEEPDVPQQPESLHVPQIRIVTEDRVGTTLQKEDGYVNASIEITDTDGTVDSADVQFKVRGNGTALPSILKKAYTFKYAKKRELFGMGKGKKWVLLANAMDVTLLRSFVSFDFAYTLGLPYASKQKMVELWVDDSFRGLYTLMEPIQEGKDRVDIDIESNDGMKDFMLELESNRVEEDVSYFRAGGIRFAVSEPEEPDADQLAYISSTTNNIVSTVQNGTEEEIREAIDVDSFAKFYLLNEYVKTADFNFSSVYFFYKDGKMYAGPPWDFDHSMGSTNDISSANYDVASKTEGVFIGEMHFYRSLCQYDWFMDEVKTIYLENRPYIENIAADGGLIDSFAAEYSAEIERNYTVAPWKVTKQWSAYQRKPLPTYQENLDFWKNWCRERFVWMDGYLNPPPVYLGDVDANGEVDIDDATWIQREMLSMELPFDFDIARADVDSSGDISVMDVTAIQYYLSGVSTPYPIGEPIS